MLYCYILENKKDLINATKINSYIKTIIEDNKIYLLYNKEISKCDMYFVKINLILTNKQF